MNDERRDHDLYLTRLLSGLADSMDHVSDEELLAEVREAGGDPDTIAQVAGRTLADAVKGYRQRGLAKAKSEYAKAVDAFGRRVRVLQMGTTAKRALLAVALTKRPDLVGVTAQWRNLESIPDSDVDGVLEQLDALGVLDDSQDE